MEAKEIEMGDAGPETTSKSSEKTPDSSIGGAEYGALDAGLRTVIAAWPKLSEQHRSIIAGIAKEAIEAADKN